MKLNNINFTKSNGGMARTADSEDPISALLMQGDEDLTFGTDDGNLKGFEVLTADDEGEALTYVRKFEYAEQLEEAGIVHTDYAGTALSDVAKMKNTLYYHVTEFFRMSPQGTLYLVITVGGENVLASDLAAVQNYAGGKIRQAGIWNATIITPATLQTQLTALEAAHKPMSVVETYLGANVTLTTLTSATLKTAGQCNVSILIGCDYTTKLENELGAAAKYGCIGACIGAISAASVNESIAWVQKFPLGFENPSLFNGTSINAISDANKELLNNNYIFVLTHVGDADCYFNDSHTLDVSTSDYAYIENVRTIDKACRGIRAKLLPHLNSPLKVDATSGKLDPNDVAYLETVASETLEEMEKAGELSGYLCEIDPDQNVLSTSTVEIVIKQVGVGVMRHVNVKIGYTTSI